MFLKFLEVTSSAFPNSKCENKELINMLKGNNEILNHPEVRKLLEL